MEPPISLPDRFLTYSSIPAWKSLVDRPPAIAERISLITVIFSDSDETEAVKCLSGDAAQSFIDVVDEVLPHSFATEDSTNLNLNFPILSSRFWIV